MLDLDKIREFLRSKNVLCLNEEKVACKIAAMRKDGYSKLQILADFDYTISYLRYGPERMSSSFGAVEKYSQMSQEFRDRTKLLHDHYYALEVDGSIPKEEKANLMTEWYQKSAGCIVESGITKSMMNDAADTSKVKIREKFDVFAECLRNHSIPILVFSAGLGQIIERVFDNAGIPQNNMKIIANVLQFDGNGTATNFNSPLITTGNKATACQKETDYFNKNADRVNSLLLGDNIEDTQMDACVRGFSKNILTLGFLNDKVDERLDLYKNTFDIVLLNDPDYSDVLQLLGLLE